MAKKNETVDVWMLSRVRGEGGEVLPARTKQAVSAGFARALVAGNRAEPYDDQDAASKSTKSKKSSKAED